ncbi:DNA-damage-inducible protein J [Singulisphaera sp. GP187]|uniref:type II toxin-antitoxin system RelB/DinJ family antitoxin n=1 Tax=Singulisphaera sp. GP187 TaxID=1882752 RepID=UPI00092BC75F|nr:type II toxin-antitoxin system RelB/DinJ family antitoxin [Singulisphaera sp. GP187]SIO28156.1 DNA-damage-inducible protein J [Singulisphaera sp. GP187]
MARTKTKLAANPIAAKPAPRDVPGARRTGMIRARVEPDLKARVEQVLDRIGLNPSEAIRLFYTQIDLAHGLPFPVVIPNATTREAMRAAEAGQVTRHADPTALFEELGF